MSFEVKFPYNLRVSGQPFVFWRCLRSSIGFISLLIAVLVMFSPHCNFSITQLPTLDRQE